MVSKPQSVLDEAKAEIAFWDDLGAVEQMRQDASGWVGLVERLVEQFEGLVKIIMNPHLDLDVAAADAQDYIKALNPASAPGLASSPDTSGGVAGSVTPAVPGAVPSPAREPS